MNIIDVIIIVLWCIIGLIQFVDCFMIKNQASWVRYWITYVMLMIMIVGYYGTV